MPGCKFIPNFRDLDRSGLNLNHFVSLLILPQHNHINPGPFISLESSASVLHFSLLLLSYLISHNFFDLDTSNNNFLVLTKIPQRWHTIIFQHIINPLLLPKLLKITRFGDNIFTMPIIVHTFLIGITPVEGSSEHASLYRRLVNNNTVLLIVSRKYSTGNNCIQTHR